MIDNMNTNNEAEELVSETSAEVEETVAENTVEQTETESITESSDAEASAEPRAEVDEGVTPSVISEAELDSNGLIKKKGLTLTARKALAGYVFVLPFILGILLIYLPILLDFLTKEIFGREELKT